MPEINWRNSQTSEKQMERKIQITEDGSHTLYLPDMDEHFHSTHGAIQESMHVFIENGLKKTTKNELVIFEVGFGTGLNAILTLHHIGNKKIKYYSIEKYPITEAEFKQLNYTEQISAELKEQFEKMHTSPWNQLIEISTNFQLYKIEGDLKDFCAEDLPEFDLVYFDAFAPSKQPEMWDESILKKIAQKTRQGGLFTTYTAKGDVRRALIKNGFNMKKVPGPPGKKEILFGDKA